LIQPRDDLAVSDDDDGVRGEAHEEFVRLVGLDPFRLEDRYAGVTGNLFDRRGGNRLAAAARAVGLRDDGDDE
jgi:hypothetical protein